MVGAAFGLGFHLRPGDRRRAEPLRSADADVVCVGALPRQLHRRVVPAARIAHGRRVDEESRPHGSVPPCRRRSRRCCCCCRCSSWSRSRSPASKRRLRSSARRNSASPRRRSGSCSRSSASCWRLVQGVLVGKVVKVDRRARLIPLAIFAIALGIGLIPFVWNVPTLLGRAWRARDRHGLQQPVADVDGVAACRSGRSGRHPWSGVVARRASAASSVRRWGGYLYDAYGMTTPYLSAAALMLFAFAVSFVGMRTKDAALRCAAAT